ncbi:MAG: GNAT family N-acetyltransferase [Devosia marina]|uniref:GNAT family N-acetyltransferase n=1 Tax=Devosia marina TaxID=2683198 RepID=UPI000D5DD89E
MRPTDLVIGPASPDLAESLGMIGFAAWEQSAFGQDDAGRADRQKLLAAFVSFCHEKQHTLLIAAAGHQILGWGAREDMDNIVTDLWVAPIAQGQGVGAALLDALEGAIAKQGFEFSQLETYAGNAGAVSFYERRGYEPIWRGMKFSASLNYELDKVRFRKFLREAV